MASYYIQISVFLPCHFYAIRYCSTPPLIAGGSLFIVVLARIEKLSFPWVVSSSPEGRILARTCCSKVTYLNSRNLNLTNGRLVLAAV